MKMMKRLRQARSIAGALAHEPSQIEHVNRWRRSIRGSTVDLRLPWVPYRVIEMLDEYLCPTHRAFEYGGGGSTLWFSDRVAELVTIEHDPDWYPTLENTVGSLPNVVLSHETDDDDWAGYVGAIAKYPDEYFDVVVVDGRQRVRCFEQAMPKVRPGGLLVLDNTDRPRYSRAFELASHWPSRNYRGLVPTEPVAGYTTVWQRPFR
jgi:predicted O-methyltransferase YrrM